MREPHFGKSHGLPVHLRTADHRTGVLKNFGVAITNKVGTMGCAILFTVISLISLPATLVQTGWVPRSAFPHWLVGQGLIGVVQWVAQTFLQLVLLSVIIVGQNAQAEAGDARAAKTFEDTEAILGQLDTKTEGGLTDVLNAVNGARSDIASFATTMRSILTAPVTTDAPQPDGAAPAAAEAARNLRKPSPQKGTST